MALGSLSPEWRALSPCFPVQLTFQAACCVGDSRVIDRNVALGNGGGSSGAEVSVVLGLNMISAHTAMGLDYGLRKIMPAKTYSLSNNPSMTIKPACLPNTSPNTYGWPRLSHVSKAG